MKRAKKRTLLMLLLLLTGGAIVNVAVAWASVLWMAPIPRHQVEVGHLPVSIPADWPDLRRHSVGSSLVLTVDSYDPPAIPDAFETYVFLSQTRAGFPWRSVNSIEARDSRDWGDVRIRPTLPDLTIWHTGLLSPQWLSNRTARLHLPIMPLWPAFAINTVFYAAVLWVLFATPGWLRRRIRGRRGQCPACAYPVGESDVCTECGAPVHPPIVGALA